MLEMDENIQYGFVTHKGGTRASCRAARRLRPIHRRTFLKTMRNDLTGRKVRRLRRPISPQALYHRGGDHRCRLGETT
ncbi:MAG: hypothetical protein ACLVGX_00130 [Oscillospiraceae bacterium]